MRWFVLIVGFLLVTILFGSTTTGMVAAAITYAIFSMMGSSKAAQSPDKAGKSKSGPAEEFIGPPEQAADPSILSLNSAFSDPDYNFPQDELDQIAMSFQPELEPNAPAKSKSRVMVVTCGIAVALLLLLGLKSWLKNSSHEQQISHPIENPLPLPQYRNQQTCLDAHFPGVAAAEDQLPESITSASGWRRGELTAGLYCAFDWDPAYVQTQLGVIRTYGLLASQWNQAEIAEAAKQAAKQAASLGFTLPASGDLHSGFPDPRIADFSRFLEGIGYASAIGELPPPFPSAKARKEARSKLNLDYDLMAKTSLPRRLILRDDSPTIALITDMPDSLKAEMIAREYVISSSGLAVKIQNNTEAWSGMKISKLMAPDFFTYSTMTYLKMLISSYLQKRSQLVNTPLEDLEVVFTRAELPIIGGHTIKRKAFYVSGKGRIYARRTGTISYDKAFEKSTKRPVALLEQLYPPELMHELNHYFFTDASLSSSPFILEGQATYEGEAALRGFRAALKYSESHSPQAFVNQPDLTPEKIKDIAQREISGLGLSRNEVLNACRAAAVFARADFSLGRLLTITNERMADLPEEFHRDLYPVAWAVYGSMAGQSTWKEQMIPLAARTLSGSLSPADREAVSRFGKLASQWVLVKLQKETIKCNP